MKRLENPSSQIFRHTNCERIISVQNLKFKNIDIYDLILKT